MSRVKNDRAFLLHSQASTVNNESTKNTMTIGTAKIRTGKQKMPKPLSRNFEASVPSLLYASLPSVCVKLFCIIKQLHSPKTLFCTATNKTLGHYAGVAPRTIGKYLKILREAGFLSVRLEVKNEGSEQKFYRFLHVSNERIDTCREIVKNFDDKRNTKQIEDFEDNEDADCEEQNEARDADTGEEVIPFEAEKSVRQAELIPPETECRRGAELVTIGTETAVAESPMEIFERTLWKHPETCEIIKERGSNKAMSFKRWGKLTNNGKRREVCDLLRTQYRKMADSRKRDGVNWNALEVFLNATSKRWETDWNATGGRVSAFINAAPRGVTVLNRTTTRTAAQVTASTAIGVADAKVATETVSETATVLGGDNLHLRDDYQKGTLPRDWVTIAVKKKLSDLNLSEGIVDAWRKITNWKFCPKELKQAAVALYDEGYRFDSKYGKVVAAGYEEDLTQQIVENAAFLAHDENLDWLIYEKAKKYFDADNNLVFDNDLLTHVFKPAEECVEFVSFDAFDGKAWLEQNATRLVKNDADFVKRLLSKIKQLSLAYNKTWSIRIPATEQPKTIQPIGTVVKTLTAETQPVLKEPKPTEPEKVYPTDDDFQKHTKPKFWFGFLKKYAKNYETKSGMIDAVRDMIDWGNFPKEMMSFLRMAFRMAKGGLSCIGFWSEFRMKNLYLMAEEEMKAVEA